MIEPEQTTKKYLYGVKTEGQDAPAKILRAVGIGKRVLEVGCASGVQTRILSQEQGCTVTGIEINPAAAEEARPFCDAVIVGDLETLDFDEALGDMLFEVITIADVLEHLREPARVLGALKKFLQPGGYIVVSIPNVAHAGLILELAMGRFDYRPYGLLDDTHLRFFTLKSVTRLFSDCDLNIDALDRVVRTVESSEFHRHPLTPEEATILAHIQSANPEWQTYQFIVKATPLQVESRASSHEALELKDRLRDLELENKVLSARARKLEDQIGWIESRGLYRLLASLKQTFRPAHGRK